MNRGHDRPNPAERSTDVSPLEVEQKYRVSSHDSLLADLLKLNAAEMPLEEHCDIYLQHPSRDFGVSGEAFRIRQVNHSAVVTYKGPRFAGPIKTRMELEIPLVEETDREWLQVFLSLGFREVARVNKQRRSFAVQFQSESFTVALDDVKRLGKFVEIEAIVHDRSKLGTVQRNIAELASELVLEEVEPRSYLTQLLELDVSKS